MADAKQKPVAVVVGVGPGLGASLARRFAAEYTVAIVARRADYLRSLANEISGAGGVALEVQADVGNRTEVAAAFKLIRERGGEPEVLLYNASAGPFGNLTEVSADQFENSMRINALGAFLCCKECVPGMVARGRGAILFTGATAGIKAGAKSVAFGPGNFAKRGLAQSLARDLGPRGIHVAWINVDGAIDLPNRKIPGLGADDMLAPDAIAETFWHVAHQHRSAWTMETEVRPFKEKF
ncbi:MAG TPA: SDR family NAD(P)-dependent oxidoreductase [Candidatus Acidoferrales bacterium]|nr:SDR family NAD(P)-dependent oxidoreductase [Candidatus Acidoferrales bacterium]